MALLVIVILLYALVGTVTGGVLIYWLKGVSRDGPIEEGAQVESRWAAFGHSLFGVVFVYGFNTVFTMALASSSDATDVGAVMTAAVISSLVVIALVIPICIVLRANALAAGGISLVFVIPWIVVVLPGSG